MSITIFKDCFVRISFRFAAAAVVIMAWTSSALEEKCEQPQEGYLSANLQHNASGHWSMGLNVRQHTPLGRKPPIQVEAKPSVTLCGSTVIHALQITLTGYIDSVPDDFVKLPGVGNYKVYSEKLTWIDAQTNCSNQRAHLLVLNSLSEATAVAGLLARTPNIGNQLFIGNKDLGKGKWITIFGQSLEEAGFDTWHPGEFDVDEGGEECGGFGKEADLWDLSCTSIHPFICEYPTIS